VLSREEQLTGQWRETALGEKAKTSEGKRTPPDVPKTCLISQRQKDRLQKRNSDMKEPQ